MSTILITGATGFLGGVVVRRAAAEGAQIRALARSPEKAAPLRDLPGVEIVPGDITDADRMREVMPGCDVVIHCAAATSGPPDLQQRANVEGTRNVAAAAGAAGVRRLVHVSSIAVYGFRRQDNVITEDMPPQPGRVAYAITKTAAEEAVRAAAARHNLSYAIIRPGMIYGPNARTWTGQAFRLARKPAGFIGNGSGAAPVIFVDDVADLCLVAAHHPAADGEIFNATPDPSPTWREYISAYARLQGHQTWFGFPVVMAKLAAYGIAPFAKRGSHARSAPELIHFITHYRTFSMDKARDLLDWQPQVTLEDGIQRCVPWLRDEGLLT